MLLHEIQGRTSRESVARVQSKGLALQSVTKHIQCVVAIVASLDFETHDTVEENDFSPLHVACCLWVYIYELRQVRSYGFKRLGIN